MSKEDATAAADAITAYDPDKVVGEAKPWQLGFQEAVTPVMQKIRGLHDHFVLYIITVIAVFVLCLLGYVCVRFRASANPTPRNFSHNTLIEVIWTAVPIIVLVAIGVPSLRVHFAYDYNQNIISHPDLTLKVVGHQWYWSYEYPDQGFGYDSNVTQDKDLKNGAPRLLTVDNPLVVPVGKVVKVQVTGADVIHDWSVPAFGIKQDAVPGRLNEVWFKAEKEGIYYGQCDQLCGKFHGFMPIEIHVVAPEVFAEWADAAKVKYASNGNVEFAALQQRK
ncbi:MAG: cytochrome c oxidase subunit II [Alphaproteobacteria bacterium]